MRQITQKDLIKLIEEKQENAKNAYKRTFNTLESDETKENQVTNKAYIDCYQDLICYINSVKIVPEDGKLCCDDQLKEESCDSNKPCETSREHLEQKYRECLDTNQDLYNELSTCKQTIVELANEVAIYRQQARRRG